MPQIKARIAQWIYNLIQKGAFCQNRALKLGPVGQKSKELPSILMLTSLIVQPTPSVSSHVKRVDGNPPAMRISNGPPLE